MRAVGSIRLANRRNYVAIFLVYNRRWPSLLLTLELRLSWFTYLLPMRSTMSNRHQHLPVSRIFKPLQALLCTLFQPDILH